MNYYPFHVGDYAAHTAHLDIMEDLAYRRMLDAYYLREGPLPCDLVELARLIRMKQNLAEVETVAREFFELTGDGWRHFRCDEEIARMKEKQDKARSSAQASVKARQANAQRTLNERSTDVELPTPTPTPEEPKTKPSAAKAARFDPLSLDLGEVPGDKWGEWVAYRKSRKLSNAEATMRAQVENLNDWLRKGHAPADVIAKSIENGWQGLFEPKEGGAGPPRHQFISHADQSKLSAARTIFGTEIEATSGNPSGNIIDITPTSGPVGRKDLSGNAGQLRLAVSEPVEDGAGARRRI